DAIAAQLGEVRPDAVIAEEVDLERPDLLAQLLTLNVGVLAAGQLATWLVPPRSDGDESRIDAVDGSEAILMPTSGTTGPPKRIPISHSQLNGALLRMLGYSAAGRASADTPRLASGASV